MTLKIKISSPANPNPVSMEVEPSDYIEDIIESVADFWALESEKFLILGGNKVYSKELKLMETDLKSGATLDFVSQEDIVEINKKMGQYIESGKNWLSENIGISLDLLNMIGVLRENGEHQMILEDSSDKGRYGVIMDNDGHIKEFQVFFSEETLSGGSINNFDSVLLINISENSDIHVGENTVQIEGIPSGQLFEDLLSKLQAGQNVQGSDAVAICALNYILRRTNESKNAKITLLPFSEKVNFIWFEGDPYFSSEIEDSTKALEGMVSKIQGGTHGKANLANALNKTIALIRNFERKKIKNIVILMDGKAESEDQVLNIVKNRLNPRNDVIINTIGHGTEVNDDLLNSIAEMTNGQYKKSSDLNGLLDIYTGYSGELKVKDMDERIERWQKVQESISQEMTAPNSCPECGLGASFLYNEKKWFCYNCQKYI